MTFDCATCRDTGHVCENHPGKPWPELAGGDCTERRDDGWPLCPGCGEDELGDIDHDPASPENDLFCYRCGRVTLRENRCGGAGMPCPACCSPIPEDGTHSIVEAFTPDRRR